MDLVAAGRVLEVRTGVRILERAAVPRLLVVVQDQLLVERSELRGRTIYFHHQRSDQRRGLPYAGPVADAAAAHPGAQPKMRRAAASPSARRSISSGVLYR